MSYDIGDPDDQHVAVAIDGDLRHPLAVASTHSLLDRDWHEVQVDMLDGHLQVDIDGSRYIDQSFDEVDDFEGYLMFTAATGSARNWHLVTNIVLESGDCW